ncbi:MAG: hypothetical protein DME06_19210 [Candidatus Rokuibacteriota bacterium]|nr:MAG: hypothetical protein DME06_19210 [Candidatus Rokubacteria bacterium]
MTTEKLRTLALDEFLALSVVILIDCEFTCWEDSLPTWWSDPNRPPELVEIGLARYAIGEEKPSHSFSCFVRPRLNPTLSPYCRSLVGVSQEEIDNAASLPEVVSRIAEWLRHLSGTTPTCGWGRGDRDFVAADAAAALGRDPGTRDSLREHWRLAPNPRRHRALEDAIDMVQFIGRVRSVAGHSHL